MNIDLMENILCLEEKDVNLSELSGTNQMKDGTGEYGIISTREETIKSEIETTDSILKNIEDQFKKEKILWSLSSQL